MKLPIYSTLFIFMISCAVKSPISLLNKVSNELPSNWSNTSYAQAGVDTQWIKRFKDSQLNSLVKEGLQNNRSLKVRSERLNQAQQRFKSSGGAAKPLVSIGGQGNRQQSRFIGLPFEGGIAGNIFNSYGVSLNTSWELDLWGKVRAQQSAELAAFQAQSWNVKAAEASLKAQITKTYFSLIEASAQTTLAKDIVMLRQQTRDAIYERFQNALDGNGGLAAQHRIAQSEVASAKAEISRWEDLQEKSSRQLELLIGRLPTAKLKSRTTLPELKSTPPVGLPSELLIRRPDILSAERRYAESVKREKEASLAYFPSFQLTGSFGTTTDSLSSVLNSSFGIWSLGAGVSQTILAGGRIKAEYNTRKSEAKARLTELQDTVIKAFSEVDGALSSEKHLRKRLQETIKAQKLAEAANRDTRLDFQSGISDIQAALNAEIRLIQTSSAVINLHRILLDNRINLHLALGGDFNLK